MNRRDLLALTTLGATAHLAGSRARAADPQSGPIRAVAFDAFAVFDPRPVGALAESLVPGKGAALMAAWRTRQFEYTWLRTLTASYADFWQVTADALAFACEEQKLDLAAAAREQLLGAHLRLAAWPDVPQVLERLKGAGVRLALLSNFTSAMLESNLSSSALAGFFDASLSTDRVRAFKPDPRSYQMAPDHLGMARDDIAFVAFGGWDAAGAKRFGFRVYWCNRSTLPAEELGVVPDRTASDLSALLAFCGCGR